jgi:putative flippase GtrA
MIKLKHFLKYLSVGFANTALCFGIMYLGFLYQLNYVEYTALGYLVAMTFSFFMNLIVTFEVEGKLLQRLSLFFIVNFINLALVEILEYCMVELLLFKPPIAVFCGMVWYVIVGFLINSRFVYAKQNYYPVRG